ncbi:hypothetical protein Krac_8631 [Ktedonobacter racemifer DSM 44963]|uniref:Uncharacterized protein n=1 Tax=Ktedonobacter racemifer DSM 44963 TaxID=485913 RepID=D6TNH0_KTERA|nr:hypothetical protein Krac_8631 [Ktedonobacter racemifer DSM 44963]
MQLLISLFLVLAIFLGSFGYMIFQYDQEIRAK